MALDTQLVWKTLNKELYFFILKKVKEENSAREILQNAFLKIHKNLPRLQQDSKVRAWSYQIVRNEIINFYHQSSKGIESYQLSEERLEQDNLPDTYCCFEKFIDRLPDKYRSVVNLVLQGKSQQEAAQALGISLANAKARVRRAKEILKSDFQECCKYDLDSNGLLTGEPDCSSC